MQSFGSPLRAGAWDPESCPGREPGHQAEVAHGPERCWQDLKPTGFHGFGHREDTFEERRSLLPPLGGKGGSHSQSALPLPDPLTERGRWGFDTCCPGVLIQTTDYNTISGDLPKVGA